ncbi:MAG: DNA alkylation repair protein [Candidatus Bathyarchaeota archaeon]
MEYKDVLNRLKSLSNPEAVEGMARFGINPKDAYGVSIPDLRKIAGEIRRNHSLSLQLWNSGIHEVRILASMIDAPRECYGKADGKLGERL